ncbi:hypothetical protein [Sphaerimonospora thailandensis]|uniref:Uncharacterized protein n=1 Tax=Sphaerimonospora thailandensis TaxID=795644 RepID=A0A8J3VYK8_9ACTN|nr:hypothetical protein [Sphaerimonospora thailandensis]GIH69016.1 hypothetical protein Mth01_12690 [Sphaerimonospora thailandensis]
MLLHLIQSVLVCLGYSCELLRIALWYPAMRSEALSQTIERTPRHGQQRHTITVHVPNGP